MKRIHGNKILFLRDTNILESGFHEMALIFLGKTWLKFECDIFSMKFKVVQQCSSLCGPRVEGIILSRTQPLGVSDLSVVMNRPNKKNIAFVINSQVPLIKRLQYVCALFVNIPLNVTRNVLRNPLVGSFWGGCP